MNSSVETEKERGWGWVGSPLDGRTDRRSRMGAALCAQSCQRSLGRIVEEEAAGGSEEERGGGGGAEAQRGVTERWFGRG